jgi:hypothetical protein
MEKFWLSYDKELTNPPLMKNQIHRTWYEFLYDFHCHGKKSCKLNLDAFRPNLTSEADLWRYSDECQTIIGDRMN